LTRARRSAAAASEVRRRANERVIQTAIERLKIKVLTAMRPGALESQVAPPSDDVVTSPPSPSATPARTRTML
jgi:hypothetical protein